MGQIVGTRPSNKIASLNLGANSFYYGAGIQELDIIISDLSNHIGCKNFDRYHSKPIILV